MRVVVVDHHDSYTHNLAHLVGAVTGALPVIVQHDAVTVDEVLGFDAVVLSPGPGHPDVPGDFAVGRDVLAAVADGHPTPVLGVCLGMQGIVSAFGGTVGRVAPAHGEVATISHDGHGLFAGLPQGFDAVRYHSLAALTVPDEVVVTARAEDDTVMGVRHRERPIEGVQFHPESILSEHGAAMIANFLRSLR